MYDMGLDSSSLVYKVTPVPLSLRDFIFDFGSLPESQEIDYVQRMVESILQLPPPFSLQDSQIISRLLVVSQKQKQKNSIVL